MRWKVKTQRKVGNNTTSQPSKTQGEKRIQPSIYPDTAQHRDDLQNGRPRGRYRNNGCRAKARYRSLQHKKTMRKRL